ncbi:MocR-like pyridoxine biosynthesis transcription factor PdxR [Dyadobacter arcticus]|uniref:GntR family transcriptional regulator/MocR family aminotransferase n=1 Tax=Dyadobacter arcticus TaxID=1078754 RepID=A0ABX0UM65_9BACT|nr:PLP-dependent aminotransferase family protein [Dyadobacter arcticus]NIJ53997.1 GntR family transcriptional regulator/MocR family aminotransferase [Dyadobacter arcticus]
MQILSALLAVAKSERQPVYLQIANQLMTLIKDGTLQPGYRLLSTRQLASSIKVHRRMVVQAYDELLAQGWLESHTGNGTFVANNLPAIRRQGPENQVKADSALKKAGFSFEKSQHLNRAVLKSGTRLHLDDGFPDPRLAPVEELSRAYRSQLLHGNPYIRLGYGDTKGAAWLRQELASHLNETRGLKITADNVLIVRGVIMGIHLVSTGLLKPGDHVAVDSPGWFGANMNFIRAGAHIAQIPVDEHGMIVDELEKLCQQQPVRLVYVTSHHHYPTTVALRADRRISLLKLAEKYGFIIFEDDYDYDFHYLSKPLLPVAGADKAGMVLYCGSFSKTISPAFRVGYLVGPEDAITHLALFRRIIDRQGDQMLENAIAELLQTGVVQRHLRKSVRVYKQRRDVFCDLLKTQLGDKVEFEIPDGGMAVWARFDPSIDIEKLAARALQKDLYFSDGSLLKRPGEGKDSIRLGFASSDLSELEESVGIIKDLL